MGTAKGCLGDNKADTALGGTIPAVVFSADQPEDTVTAVTVRSQVIGEPPCHLQRQM